MSAPFSYASPRPSSPECPSPSVERMKTWMQRRGDRVNIISGKYAGHLGPVESKVYQRTVDYPDEFANGHHVLLESGVLVTVRYDQVEGLNLLSESYHHGP